MTAAEPSGATWDQLITAQSCDENGLYHLGALTLDQEQYNLFRAAQQRIGGKPAQLETLWSVEHGTLPAQMIDAAPHSASLEALLRHGRVDINGLVHFGNLAVPADKVRTFIGAQQLLARCTPDALGALYRLEHGDRKYIFAMNDHAGDDFAFGLERIDWDPHKLIRDRYSGAMIPPIVALLHEESHAIVDPVVRDTLSGIPSDRYTNYEEMRVITGPEYRMMRRNGWPPRESHIGVEYETAGLESRRPLLHVMEHDREGTVAAPFERSGRVHTVDERYVTLEVGDELVRFRTNELMGFMGAQKTEGGETNAVAVFNDAASHADTVTISLTADGKVMYRNDLQHRRWEATPPLARYFDLNLATTIGAVRTR